MNWFYRRFPTLLIARRNLTRTKLRSGLAILGIVIGVVAIASLGVFGATLQQTVTGSLGGIGNQIIVSPATDHGVKSLSDRDIREISRVSGDSKVVPVRQGATTVSYRSDQKGVVVYGMNDPNATYAPKSGYIPSPFRSGVLVGSNLADSLDLRVGSSLTVGNRTYRVQAILQPQQSFSPVNPDSGVILPIRDVPGTGYSQVVVSAQSGQSANATAVAIRQQLNARQTRVSIFELGSIVDQIGSVFSALNLFLVGIGSISLLVAGVSILNVMLMSTIERRGEIGVLRAVGYQKRDVLKILLSEALLLGFLGGIVGGFLSLLGGLVINYALLHDPLAVFTPSTALYIAAAIAFGLVTSVLSGLYPAYKAANEQPVEALRS